MDEIKKILEKYKKEDYQIFEATIDMLFKKGIPNGFFNDYAVLNDVIVILVTCRNIIKQQKNNDK